MNDSPLIKIVNLTKYYINPAGKKVKVLDGITMDVREEFMAILGPSGCGKSTLLRIMAGVEKFDEGKIVYGGDKKPRIGFVFQFPTLLPWMTVLGNVMLPLLAEHVPEEEARERARRALALVGLEEFADFYPGELSGGMKQRVNFARALSIDPTILLMDEPFSNLDPLTAEALRNELIDLWLSNVTRVRAIVMVTHNVEEAVMMADRIVILSPRPARIVSMVDVKLPRPRNRRSEEIQKLVDQVYGLVS
ncbi:MAG: ABC transporter ATP-binding protein [Desulfurococcaceae archaeon]